MKATISAAGFLVLLLALTACHTPLQHKPHNGGAESECVKCHTDAPRLATLAQEMEKIRPRLGPSPESTGEC